MSFFRNIRSSLSSSRAKSSSRNTTPVRSSRPASVISGAASSRRDSIASSTLQRGDTFILNGSEEEERSPSNCSTLEKKSKKSKVFSKFSTFTKRKKTPSPEEVASYDHHPSDTATNTYYKWRSEGGDRLVDYDAQADPFNFLYEQQSSLKALQTGSNDSSMHRQASLNSNSSGSFDSSTYRKSKTPTHLREQLEQLKTHSNDDLLEDQQQEEDERDKYKTVTLNSFRKSFRERLLQQQKEAPHNPAWFVEVPPETSVSRGSTRWESKENRPDFLVFENDNYRPQSRSPLRDRPTRSATRSPVKRNETFRVTQPSLRHSSPSPARPAPSIRIEIKNSISPHAPGKFVPVGVAKPMPTTEYYAQRLLANQSVRQVPHRAANSNRWYQQQPQQQQHHSPTREPAKSGNGGGRYQTLVHIGSEPGKSAMTMPARGRAPTRVQLFGSKPTSVRPPVQQQQQPTYFGGHYNAPVTLQHHHHSSSSRVSSGGVPSVYVGRRDPPATRAAPAPRRNRSPIKIPWR